MHKLTRLNLDKRNGTVLLLEINKLPVRKKVLKTEFTSHDKTWLKRKMLVPWPCLFTQKYQVLFPFCHVHDISTSYFYGSAHVQKLFLCKSVALKQPQGNLQIHKTAPTHYKGNDIQSKLFADQRRISYFTH